MEDITHKASQRIAIIGAGKVGLTLGKLLQKKKFQIIAIAGRNPEKTKESAKLLGNTQASAPLEAAKQADLIFLTVPDDAIEAVCRELSANSAFTANQILVHCSGALTSEVLASARASCGTAIASAHPLQTFSSIESGLESLPGAFWFCEGDKKALDVLLPLIAAIEGKSRLIETEKKALYHAASVFACNYLVTLMDIAITSAEAAGLDGELAWQALQPLVQATINNINSRGSTASLTGPIARGDIKTVERHLEALTDIDPELSKIYSSLGSWTTRIALRKGLAPEQAEALQRLLSTAAKRA